MAKADVVIAGAGIAGMALALELRRRGRDVLLLHRDHPGTASLAAAGMLAAHDPHNPPALQPLADLAMELYPDFLARIRDLSGHPVSIHTRHVLEPDAGSVPGHTLVPTLLSDAGNFRLREEESLDPRELHAALSVAITVAGVRQQIFAASTDSRSFDARQSIDCTGAWSPHTHPVKGQMLRVQLPPNTFRLPTTDTHAVIRTEDIYLVPRLDGTTLIGATVEDAGFDLALKPADLQNLRNLAAALISAAATAPEVESWAGLRPRTSDDLPILGELAPNHFVANGLFRNGILLAPAVALVMAQLLCGEEPQIDLTPFSPHRPPLIRQR